jgi:hypothetical protein
MNRARQPRASSLSQQLGSGVNISSSSSVGSYRQTGRYSTPQPTMTRGSVSGSVAPSPQISRTPSNTFAILTSGHVAGNTGPSVTASSASTSENANVARYNLFRAIENLGIPAQQAVALADAIRAGVSSNPQRGYIVPPDQSLNGVITNCLRDSAQGFAGFSAQSPHVASLSNIIGGSTFRSTTAQTVPVQSHNPYANRVEFEDFRAIAVQQFQQLQNRLQVVESALGQRIAAANSMNAPGFATAHIYTPGQHGHQPPSYEEQGHPPHPARQG